jgi:hypothetical protein
MNLGGQEDSARLSIEELAPEDIQIEYITNPGKGGYKLAQRTYPLFQSIGHADSLAKSVKNQPELLAQ